MLIARAMTNYALVPIFAFATAIPSLAPVAAITATTDLAKVVAVSTAASAVSTLRGGAAAAAVDLTRAALRIDSLHAYTVVSSIVLGAVIDVYTSCPKKNHTKRSDKIAVCIHAIFTSISFLAGLYVILLFSLFNMYANAALGDGFDQAYLDLLRLTASIRLQGFRGFLLCLISFETALIANIFLNFQGRARWIFSGLAALGAILSLKEWSFIVRFASEIIFK
jgi:hypothetical protein